MRASAAEFIFGQHRRAPPGSDTDRSATGPDRHPRTAGCRRRSVRRLLAADRAGRFRSPGSAIVASIIHAVAGRLGSERSIKPRPARRARSARPRHRPEAPTRSPATRATPASDAGGRGLSREAPQSRQPRGVRAGKQFVQRRMRPCPDDLGQAQRGEAEQPRVQRILCQRSVQRRRKRRAPAGRQAGEIHQDRAGKVAQPDLPRQRRQHRQVRRQWRQPCPAAGPPRPPHRRRSPSAPAWDECAAGRRRADTSGCASAWTCSSMSSSKARRDTDTIAQRWPQSGCQRVVVDQDRGVRIESRQFQQRARAACRRRLVRREPRSQPRPLAPLCRARDADRHEVALAQAAPPSLSGRKPSVPSSARKLPAMAGTRATTRPRCRSPTPSGAPGRQIA